MQFEKIANSGEIRRLRRENGRPEIWFENGGFSVKTGELGSLRSVSAGRVITVIVDFVLCLL